MINEELLRCVDIKKCVYGLGKRSKPAMEILKHVGLYIDYICDRDEKVLLSYAREESEKMSLEDLLCYSSSLLVIITIGGEVSKTVKNGLVQNKNLILVFIDELIKMDYLINRFVGIDLKTASEYRIEIEKKCEFNSKSRVAIYTCITGGYDEIAPLNCIEEDADYFFITDNIDENIILKGNYNLIDVETVVPKELTGPKERNRYVKMHGYEIFSDYDYSIYIDGNLEIKKPIRPFLSLVGEWGLAMHKLTECGITDSYEEALFLYLEGRVDYFAICNTLSELAREGLPRHCGVVYGNVIVCDNHNSRAIRLLNEWFDKYQLGQAKRDQFYLPLVLWKNGINIGNITTLPGMAHTNGYFELLCGHSGEQTM